MSQGARANMTGRVFENLVGSTLSSYGFTLVEEINESMSCFATQVPYRNIYGCVSKSDFVVRCPRRGLDTRIECRYQQVGGSVDEKLPFLFLNAVKAMPETQVLIILGGGGARTKATQWLFDSAMEVNERGERIIEVLSLEGFLRWSNDNLGGEPCLTT